MIFLLRSGERKGENGIIRLLAEIVTFSVYLCVCLCVCVCVCVRVRVVAGAILCGFDWNLLSMFSAPLDPQTFLNASFASGLDEFLGF